MVICLIALGYGHPRFCLPANARGGSTEMAALHSKDGSRTEVTEIGSPTGARGSQTA